MNNFMTHINNALQGLLFDYKRLWINPFAIAFVLLALLGAGIKVIAGLLVMASVLSLIAHGITSYIKDGKLVYRQPKKPKTKTNHSASVEIVEAEVVDEEAPTVAPASKVKTDEKKED